jgi:hypothetical protein
MPSARSSHCLCKEKQIMPIKHDSELVREKYREQDPQWLPPPDDTGVADPERARRQGGQGAPQANPAAKRAGRAKSQDGSKSKGQRKSRTTKKGKS